MEQLKKKWKHFLFEGIVFVVLGGLAAALPGLTTLSFEMLIGILLVIGGLLQAWRSFQLPEKGTEFFLALLGGVLFLVTGILMLVYPLVGMLTLTMLLALFFLIEGIIESVRAIRFWSLDNSGWLLFSGLVAIAIAWIIWSGWPTSAIWFIGLLIAINLIIYGCTKIVFALALRRFTKNIDTE